MSAQLKSFPVRPLVRAVQGALVLMATVPCAVFADDSDVTALTTPTNTIQVGVGDNAKKDPKFGEYNGLYDKGGDITGSLNLFGGDAYGQGSGTIREGLKATDLGTTSRSVDAWLISQGNWRVGASFDQLRHEFTNTYQSPLVGSVGGANFVLPQQFGVVQTSSVTPGAAYGAQALTPTQLGLFNTYDVHSDRKTLTLSAGVDISDQVNFRLSWGHVVQDGAKLMAAPSDVNNVGHVSIAGSNYTTVAAPGKIATGPQGEAPQIIMNPTDYVTDNINATVNYVGAKGYATLNLLLSDFQDKNTEVTFSNPFTNQKLLTGSYIPTGTLLNGAFPTDAISTMPSNQFYQASVTGGYDLLPKTHLVGNLSLGDGRQNMAYPNQAWDMWAYSYNPATTPGSLPQPSLDGRVETRHADLRLTDRSIDRLTLGADMRYNERLNTTDSATYNWFTPSSENTSAVNAPLSTRRIQETLSADYRIASSQSVRLAYDHEKYDRWCQNAAANNAEGPNPSGSTQAAYYGTSGHTCVQVPDSTENRETAAYKLALTEDLHFDASGAYSVRKSTLNSAFYNPIQAEQGGQGYENYGYVAFFQASRDEKTGKVGLDWQLTRILDIDGKLRLVEDNYPDSAFGVQHSKTAGADLDANLTLGEQTTVTGFATWQHGSRMLYTASGRDAVATTGLTTWENYLVDDATTLGISLRQGGLLNNRLSLKADIIHSLDNTRYTTQFGTYTSANCTTDNNGGFNCGSPPNIRSDMSEIQLSGAYQLDKKSTLTLGYVFQKLDAADPYYNYYQSGYNGTSTMPTNQQSPSYTQNRVFATYSYSFQ